MIEYKKRVEDKKTSKEINVNSLIALCEIGEEYPKFCEELESLIKSNKNKDLIYKVYRIMIGKFTPINYKYKKFVQKYKNIIEIMKNNQCLSDMTVVKYNPNGKPNKNSTEDYFCEYILQHKEDIETIKNVAIKIKSLGFDKIIFDEKLQFTDTEYELSEYPTRTFEFLENIELIPKYPASTIKYKTNGSCYRMKLTCVYKVMSEYNKEIELNSLIFDPNRLPDEISKESTVEKITQESKKLEREEKKIKDVIDLCFTTDKLIQQFNSTREVIEKIDRAKNKEEVKQALRDILNGIMELKNASVGFEYETIERSKIITDEIIEKEKRLYLERKNRIEVDCC